MLHTFTLSVSQTSSNVERLVWTSTDHVHSTRKTMQTSSKFFGLTLLFHFVLCPKTIFITLLITTTICVWFILLYLLCSLANVHSQMLISKPCNNLQLMEYCSMLWNINRIHHIDKFHLSVLIVINRYK